MATSSAEPIEAFGPHHRLPEEWFGGPESRSLSREQGGAHQGAIPLDALQVQAECKRTASGSCQADRHPQSRKGEPRGKNPRVGALVETWHWSAPSVRRAVEAP